MEQDKIIKKSELNDKQHRIGRRSKSRFKFTQNLFVVSFLTVIVVVALSWTIGEIKCGDITVIVIAWDQIQAIQQSVDSIMSTNTDIICKLIVVYEGTDVIAQSQFSSITERFTNYVKNFQFIINTNKMGPLVSIDQALKRVTSSYYFLSIGTWKYHDNSFMKEAQQILENNESISQVVYSSLDQVDTIYVQFVHSMLAGFTLLPSLHRLEAYKSIQNGFSGITANISIGKQPGFAENLISKLYMENNYRIAQLGLKIDKISRRYSYVAPPFKLKKDYLYKRFWKTNEEEKQICSFTLLYEQFRAEHHSHRRSNKKKLVQSFQSIKQKQVKGYDILGIEYNIQIGSEFDYLGILGTSEYLNFEKNFASTLHFEPIKHDLNYEENIKYQININQFSSFYGAIEYVFNQKISLVPNERNQLQLQIKLAACLINNPYDSKYIQAEYLIHNEIHELATVNKSLKLCIFIEGYNIFSRSSLIETLKSISRQNYTNYEVVFVSDENDDSSRDLFMDIVSSTQPKIYNRLKAALYNEDILGTSGNVYIRARQFCKNADVIVVVNGKSTFIGNQAFNVINKAFQNQSTWVTIFPSIMQNANLSYFMGRNINFSQDLRQAGFDTSQYLVTFRYDLVLSLPLSHVIQFSKNRETGFIFPSFYEGESNSFYVFSLIQLSGRERTHFFKAAIFYFQELLPSTNKRCNEQQRNWIRSKSILKYPVMKLKSLKDNAILDKSQPVKIQALSSVRFAYQELKKCIGKNKQQNNIQQLPFENSLGLFLDQTLMKIKFPNFYIMNDQNIVQIGDLPYCLVVNAVNKNNQQKQELLKSIQAQNYTNYTLLIYEGNHNFSITLIKSQVNQQIWKKYYNFTAPSLNYFCYKRLFNQFCVQNSLIMVVNSPLKTQALRKLNQIHQRSNTWMTYSVEDNIVQIHSFYMRVFELVQKNDFFGTNVKYLQQQDYELPVLAMMELSLLSSYKLRYTSIYIDYISTNSNKSTFNSMRAYRNSTRIYTRHPYQYLQTLSQNIRLNLQAMQTQLSKLHQNKEYLLRPNINSYLSKVDMLRAFQYEQIPYLPDNHMLNKREYAFLDRQYSINKYVSGQYANKTTRFCCTIFGRNNTENQRYINNLKSIVMQNYSNFHIVLLDDASDDQTLKLSMQFMKKSKFPKERVTYVQNLNRTFATYNIINSAFSFCDANDVQVRIDGDDIILGRNVFSLLNAVYMQNPQLWITYTSYKSSIFTYGLSSRIERKQEMVNCEGGRRRFHFIGPLTTWRVKLIRSIPIKYHELPTGQWLNTLYDDALQFPMFQLATIQRIKYIPYISYNYNTKYGSNDDSDKQKIKDRIALFEYVVSLNPLESLSSLDDPRTINQQIPKILQQDFNTVYKQVFL